MLSTFSDFPEDFHAAAIHLGYSHGADNLEAELSIDIALSDREPEKKGDSGSILNGRIAMVVEVEFGVEVEEEVQ